MTKTADLLASRFYGAYGNQVPNQAGRAPTNDARRGRPVVQKIDLSGAPKADAATDPEPRFQSK